MAGLRTYKSRGNISVIAHKKNEEKSIHTLNVVAVRFNSYCRCNQWVEIVVDKAERRLRHVDLSKEISKQQEC